jgi:hypothetical protein
MALPNQSRDRKMHAEVAELLKRTDLLPDERQSLEIYGSMRYLTRLHRMEFERIKAAHATPAQVVERLLGEGKLPPVQELFRIFSKVNQDLASNIGKDDSQPVDFTDVEFYADQISAMWEDTVDDWEKIWAAAVHLRDYAKSQNYVLPGRPTADTDARRLAARMNRNGPATKMIGGVKMKMTPGGTWTRAE